MKKVKKEVKMLNVLTTGEPDDTYNGNKVIAVDDIEKLEQYKKQLLEHGYNKNYQIEERENDGWSSGIRFSGYHLKEYNGLLYPQRNIDIAQRQIDRIASDLVVTYERLNEFKEGLTDEEKQSVNTVLELLEKKNIEVNAQQLNVEMLL